MIQSPRCGNSRRVYRVLDSATSAPNAATTYQPDSPHSTTARLLCPTVHHKKGDHYGSPLVLCNAFTRSAGPSRGIANHAPPWHATAALRSSLAIGNDKKYRWTAYQYFDQIVRGTSRAPGTYVLPPEDHTFDITYLGLGGDLEIALGGAHFSHDGGTLEIRQDGTWKINVKMRQTDYFTFAPRGFLGYRMLLFPTYAAARNLQYKYGYKPFMHTETWPDVFDRSNAPRVVDTDKLLDPKSQGLPDPSAH